MQSVYTASEHDMSAMVCVAVKQGSLGIFVNLSLTTHNASAQGMHIFHKFVYAPCRPTM